MFNCWIILYLLFCGCNNGSSGCGCNNGSGGCGCNNSCGNTKPKDCTPPFSPPPSNNGCGCDNDFIQPRGFFAGGSSTCGCEANQSNE